MEKLKLNDVIKINDNEKIYDYLLKKALELGEEICVLKNKEFVTFESEEAEAELYNISETIYYESISFEDYSFLRNKLREFRNECLYEKDKTNAQTKIKYFVKVYNELIDELNKYNKQKERIEKEGFENLDKTLKDGLREVFCKMLDYKKRKYDKNASLPDLIKELTLCYYDYEWLLEKTYEILKMKGIYKDTIRDDFWTVRADDVEYIDILEETYNFFATDENTYKNYDKHYEEITLKDGQTLEDLYNEEREKLRLLFIEMLEFLNVEIKETNYYYLESRVRIHYPYYSSLLTRGSHSYSYIESYYIAKSNYEILKAGYKEHDEFMKKYNEGLDDEELDIIDDYDIIDND